MQEGLLINSNKLKDHVLIRLNRVKHLKILNLHIYKTPIPDLSKSIINLFVKTDHLYHVGLVFTLEEMEMPVIIEKNLYPTISFYLPENAILHHIPGPYDFTIEQLLYKTIYQMGDDAFTYDATQNNCQIWVYQCLKSVGKNTPDITQKIIQSENIFDVEQNVPMIIISGFNKSIYIRSLIHYILNDQNSDNYYDL